MQAAIFAGLYDLNVPSVFECPSSQCEWPSEFTTLAVSSKCANVTSTSVAEGLACGYNNIGNYRPESSDQTSNCTFTTPGGLNFTNYVDSGSYVEAPTIFNAVSATDVLNRFSSRQEINSPDFLRFAVFAAADTGGNSPSNSYEITECTLSFVAQTYRNVSSRGNEFVVGDVTTHSFGNGTRYLDLGLGLTPANKIMFNVANTSASPKVKDYKFRINSADFFNVIAFLGKQVFNGTMRSGPDYYGARPRQMTAQVLLTSNITKVAANIARRMTDQIRNGRNATRAEGTAFVQESYIRVRWGWLALPAGVLLASTGVFVVCVLYNERRRIVLWKSSSLALLFHFLDGWNPQDHRVSSVTQLGVLAKEIHAQIQDDDMLRFTKA